MADLTTGEIAQRAGGELTGDPARVIRGVAPIDEAESDEISFLASDRYAARAAATRAGAVLLPRDSRCELPADSAVIRVEDPYAVLVWLLPLLYPEPPAPPGIHPTAVIAEDVTLGDEVRIEALAVIGPGARIGDRARIGAQAFVGRGAEVGADSVLHPQVTLYPNVRIGERCIVHSGARIGVDGFRYVFLDGRHQKIPQIGGCVIGDDVEIGANTTIDRGSIGDTVIGRGTKIDNLVQIGHNTKIGKHAIIIAQVGISGSTTIGDGVVMGGQAGTAGHLNIGAGARIAGRGAVTADVAAGETVSGYPARPHREAMRAQAALFRLPQLLKRVQQLEQSLSGSTPPSGEDAGSTRSDG